jgi:hypothetical protein
MCPAIFHHFNARSYNFQQGSFCTLLCQLSYSSSSFDRGVSVLSNDDVRRFSGKEFCSLSIISIDARDVTQFMKKVEWFYQFSTNFDKIWSHIHVPASRIGPTHLTYTSQDAWRRILIISSGLTNRRSTTHMLPRPHWRPQSGALTLGAAQIPPTPAHFIQAETWLSESYKKMPHLGRSVQSSFIVTTNTISS